MNSAAAVTVYRWNDLPHDFPMKSLARRRIIGHNMMISEVFLQKGCRVPAHHHTNEQFCCVLTGALKFGIGEVDDPDHREVVVQAGEVLHLPCNVPHSADALEDTLVLDLFSPPSQTTGIDRPGGGT